MKQLIFIVTFFIFAGCASVDNKESRVPAQTADFGKTNFSSRVEEKFYTKCFILDEETKDEFSNYYEDTMVRTTHRLNLYGYPVVAPNSKALMINSRFYYKSKKIDRTNGISKDSFEESKKETKKALAYKKLYSDAIDECNSFE